MSEPSAHHMTRAIDGFLLLDGFLTPIYASPGAIEILRHGESPKRIKILNGCLSVKVQSLLLKDPASPKHGFVDEFRSGRRRYSCRAFVLNVGSNHSREARKVVLLLERFRKPRLESLALAERFNLT